jgi:hypothetical protein
VQSSYVPWLLAVPSILHANHPMAGERVTERNPNNLLNARSCSKSASSRRACAIRSSTKVYLRPGELHLSSTISQS